LIIVPLHKLVSLCNTIKTYNQIQIQARTGWGMQARHLGEQGDTETSSGNCNLLFDYEGQIITVAEEWALEQMLKKTAESRVNSFPPT